LIAPREISEAVQPAPAGDGARAVTRHRLLSHIGAEVPEPPAAWIAICICVILAAFGDALGPVWIGEAGPEVAVFDLGEEFSVLAMQHWHLRLLLGAAALAAGIAVLRIGGAGFDGALCPTSPRGVEKVPIKL